MQTPPSQFPPPLPVVPAPPEEHDKDGGHAVSAHNRAVNDLTGSSIHVPVAAPADKESAITVELHKTDAHHHKTKSRDIAPWLTAVDQAQGKGP